MKYLLAILILLSMAALPSALSGQNYLWRVDQRVNGSWGYIYDESVPGNWAYHSTQVEENINYHPAFPEMVEYITRRKKATGYGEDGLWHDLVSIYCNPLLSHEEGHKIISYDSLISGHNYQREEVYDAQGRLSILDRRIASTGYLSGTQYDFFYGAQNRVDSLKIRYYSFIHDNWEKRIMSYNSSGRKTGELVLVSSDNENWQPIKRAIIYQSGANFPPAFHMQSHHMLFDLSSEGYMPTVLYQWIPGLTDCGIVDSLITQDYNNGIWEIDTRDDYNVNQNTDGSWSFTIYSWDQDMIGVPDYMPGCWALCFDGVGHYRGHNFSSDDGLSPPSDSGTSYIWSYSNDQDDPQLAPVPDLEIKAWPNPFRETVQVLLEIPDAKAETRIGIYNLKGQKVYAQNGVGKQWMWNGKDFSGRDLGAGIYFIRAENSGHWTVKKVLKD